MSGGTGNWSMSMQTAHLHRSTASIRFTFFTPAGPLESRREFCTPPVAISWTFTRQPNTSSTFAMKISFGARLMWAGSPVTVILSMDRLPMAPRSLCTRAHRTGPSLIGFGKSSKNTGSTFSILPRRRFAHLFAGATNGWRTETGSILITPLPGAIPTKPGSATLPFFGIDPAVVDEKGREVGPNVGGKLIIRRPWPSMLRTIYGDNTRYRQQYWSEFKGNYLTGDGARRDEDGYFWIVGRIDDVLNVAGHRLGTSEIESALVSHRRVAEAAVVGRPDELKGQGVVAFVTLKTGVDASRELKEELRDHVGAHIADIAKPEEVRFAEALPKKRSGKIMRRLLKEIAGGAKVTGDTTTLEDFSVLAKLAESEE